MKTLALDLPWGRLTGLDAEGAGTPVLFLHGTGCDAADWAGVVRRLPSGLRAVCVDFRGHGGSDAPAEPFTLADLASDVLALLAHLHIEAALLVGHSLGGMVAMAAAARSPQVAGLILLEGWTSLGVVGHAFEAGPHFYGGLPPPAIAEIKAKRAIMQARFPPAVWTPFWNSVEAYDAWPYLAGARIPILEVYGDAYLRQGTREVLRIPDNPAIVLHWIKGAGHYLPHERPEEVAALVRDFGRCAR